jgi:uncharacterized membrane protein
MASSTTQSFKASAATAQDTITRGLHLLGSRLSRAGLDSSALDAGQRELRVIADSLRRLAAQAGPIGNELAGRVATSARPIGKELASLAASARPLGHQLYERFGATAGPLRDELLGRVAGRATAGAMLTQGLRAVSRNRTSLATAAAAIAGLAAISVMAKRHRAAQANGTAAEDEPVVASVTINRPQGDVYRFWRELENVPQFMDRIASVKQTGQRTSHWVAKAPAGTTVAWDAEITEDVRDERIAWRSLEGSTVATHGNVRFSPAPGGRGTAVRVELFYRPPGGPIGTMVAKLLGEAPEQQLRGDLRRLAQLLETGEITTNKRRAS